MAEALMEPVLACALYRGPDELWVNYNDTGRDEINQKIQMNSLQVSDDEGESEVEDLEGFDFLWEWVWGGLDTSFDSFCTQAN